MAIYMQRGEMEGLIVAIEISKQSLEIAKIKASEFQRAKKLAKNKDKYGIKTARKADRIYF